ncbi:unnamed protein product [Rotaria sp. Silwood2]|nr:unnamed protein product [Rotaria sp. Silwood2]
MPNAISGMPTSVSTPSIPLHFPCSQQLPNISYTSSTDTHSSTKAHTSELLLLATYFDIGIIRTLFIPSWLTDGYLWCLEYLHKRMINISDEILSDALTTGILPINILRCKSLSMPQLKILNKYNYYKYLENNYFNEQITQNIVEQQCMTTTTSNSIKQSSKLLNIPFQYFSDKFSYDKKYNRKYNFYKKKSRIHYIDEDGIEHLDLANIGRHNDLRASSSPQSSRFRSPDPTLLLFKASILNNKDTIRQSADFDNNIKETSTTTPTTNLNAMKTYSVSDSDINYKFLEEIEEAQGSNGYINRNGTINFGVILAGIHAVICKEYHLKACELVMNILDVLFGLAVISSAEDEIYKKKLSTDENNHMTTTDDRATGHIEGWLKQIDAIEDEKFQLALDIILRILKRLGCSNCQARGRSFTIDQLRDESKASDVYDTRRTSTEKIRLDTEAHEQVKNRDCIATRINTNHDGRANNSPATNTFHCQQQQQQQLNDNSLNLSSKTKLEKIRANEALNVLETYYARYRIRCADTSYPRMSLLRSVTVTGDRSSSTINRSFQYDKPMKEDTSDQSPIDNEIAPKLRTFHGWKRNIAHLDKSRSTKSSRQSPISKQSSTKYNTTKEMSSTFRSIRQANERRSDSSHAHASHNRTILNSFFDDNTNTGDGQTSNSSIPLTEIVLRQSETSKKPLVSHLSNTAPVTVDDDDDESQL